MRLGILTSSRADFGIYLPLLKKLEKDTFFEVEIIAFGTHSSHFHGYSLQHILNEHFKTVHVLESLVLGDSEESVATAMGLTTIKFASFWSCHSYDLVLCLGDRYEMFAAVSSSIPFNIKLAHLHGGETTAGAIDDIFRHCISLASSIHFCSTSTYQQRLFELIGSQENIYNVGALSLDNLLSLNLFSSEEFFQQWNINLGIPTVLVTLHPETKSDADNIMFANIVSEVITNDKTHQYVVTMPNADTHGNAIRQVFENRLALLSHVQLVENFGTKGYFSCMKHCSLILGNSSSGIIEAASVGTYVINLGSRQKGRAKSSNVFDVPFDSTAIAEAIKHIESLPPYSGENIYWQGGASEKIIGLLKSLHGRL